MAAADDIKQKFDSLQRTIAAAIIIQGVSSGPDFVTEDRLNETLTSMSEQKPGTGWVCAALTEARGVVTALKIAGII